MNVDVLVEGRKTQTEDLIPLASNSDPFIQRARDLFRRGSHLS